MERGIAIDIAGGLIPLSLRASAAENARWHCRYR